MRSWLIDVVSQIEFSLAEGKISPVSLSWEKTEGEAKMSQVSPAYFRTVLGEPVIK